jgi:ABC-2 type transport system ATP-binding protein
MSTHVLQEAQAVCDRLLIVHKGRLVASGSTNELTATSRGDRILTVELEGERIEDALRGVSGVSDVTIIDTKNARICARITTNPEQPFEPELSRLAAAHQWIIWRLTEETNTLERVFEELTRY